jgi:signal peptidase I
MPARFTKIAAWGVVAVLLTLAIKALFLGYYRIPQNGMYPTLPAGSHVFVFRRAYTSPSSVKRGDIVFFVRRQNEQRYTYVLRVVGLPGDIVTAVGEALTINGQPAAQVFIRDEQAAAIFRQGIGHATYEIAFSRSPKQRPPDASVTVPSDQFFLMGDNRFSSYDSRYFGTVPFGSIIGKKL